MGALLLLWKHPDLQFVVGFFVVVEKLGLAFFDRIGVVVQKFGTCNLVALLLLWKNWDLQFLIGLVLLCKIWDLQSGRIVVAVEKLGLVICCRIVDIVV